MAERAAKRQKKFAYEVGDLPHLFSLRNRTILGSQSWTGVVDMARWIPEDKVIDIGFGVQTETEIARDYIIAKYKGRPKIMRSQFDEMFRPRRAPLAAKSGWQGYGYYLDIKSAYWSILKVVGWQADYAPLRWLTVRDSVEDFPVPHLKLARNALISSGMKISMQTWTGARLQFEEHRNQICNMPLWCCVMDTLNCVAGELWNAGAVYVHTDGYIVPHHQLDRAIEIITSWGLPYSVKAQGDTMIYGVGNYQVGEKSTRNKHLLTQPLQVIDDRYVDWLKPRFISMVAYRRQQNEENN